MAAAETTIANFLGLTVTVGGGVAADHFFGMNASNMLFGLFGGFIMLTQSKPASIKTVVCNMIISAVLAGVFAPVLSALAVHHIQVLSNIGPIIDYGCAVIIGGLWQKVIPMVSEIVQKKLGGKKP